MYRDPSPEVPACPVCDSADQVKAHDNPNQGRWLALCCMVLFDGTSAEWHRPEREREPVGRHIDDARAALKGDNPCPG